MDVRTYVRGGALPVPELAREVRFSVQVGPRPTNQDQVYMCIVYLRL